MGENLTEIERRLDEILRECEEIDLSKLKKDRVKTMMARNLDGFKIAMVGKMKHGKSTIVNELVESVRKKMK